MRVIPQSFTPLKDSHDIITQIGNRARICYQSEPKGDETGFVKGLIKKGHNSCLEMAVLHLQMADLKDEEIKVLSAAKFLIYDRLDRDNHYVTGSIRAWREWLMTCSIPLELTCTILEILALTHPVFFANVKTVESETLIGSLSKVYLIEPRYIPKELRWRHIHQAIQIITNRVVTHEIVRHRPCSYLQESQRYVRYDHVGGIEFIVPSAFWAEDSEEYKLWAQHMEWSEKTYTKLLRTTSPQAARLALPNSCKTEIIVYCNLREWEHILAMRHHAAADPSMQELMAPMFDWFVENHPGEFSTQGNLKRSIG